MAFLAPIATAAVGAFSAATPLTLAATGLQVAGALAQGRAESQALTYNAMVASNNARLSNQNAKLSEEQARMDAYQADLSAGQEIGQLVADASATGLTGGSIAMRQVSARRLAGRDRLAILEGGANQAREWRQRAADLYADARFNTSSARNSRVSTFINVGSSLISGASSVNRSKILSLSAEA